VPPGVYTRTMHRALRTAVLTCPALLCACEGFEVRPGATSILEAFQPPPPAEAVKMALSEDDPNARYRGTQLLAGASFAGEPHLQELFLERIDDADPGVRALAIRSVGTHGTPEHAEKIAAHLTDDEVAVRIEAARALQRLHAPGTLPALVDALSPAKQEEHRVRAEAATALGQYHDRRAVEALIGALSDESLLVNTRARDALRMLTGNDMGLDRRAWNAWYKTTPDVFAASAGYTYPVFWREKKWYEHIPLIPPPPNEAPTLPAGLSPTAAAK